MGIEDILILHQKFLGHLAQLDFPWVGTVSPAMPDLAEAQGSPILVLSGVCFLSNLSGSCQSLSSNWTISLCVLMAKLFPISSVPCIFIDTPSTNWMQAGAREYSRHVASHSLSHSFLYPGKISIFVVSALQGENAEKREGDCAQDLAGLCPVHFPEHYICHCCLFRGLSFHLLPILVGSSGFPSAEWSRWVAPGAGIPALPAPWLMVGSVCVLTRGLLHPKTTPVVGWLASITSLLEQTASFHQILNDYVWKRVF